MKLSLKFSLSVILLIAAVLSLGCVLFLQQDFDENIRQAKTAAAQEHSRQAALIQMMLDEDSPDSQGAVSSSLFQYADSLKSYGAQSQLALYQGELMAGSQRERKHLYAPDPPVPRKRRGCAAAHADRPGILAAQLLGSAL